MDKPEPKSIEERIEDGQREIGVLLLAFTPLDFSLNRHSPGDFNYMLMFLGLGTTLFFSSLIQERRRHDATYPILLLIFPILGVSLMLLAFQRGLGI